MYAGGAAHPHREACRGVLQQVTAGTLGAVVSAEVVLEILHRFSRGDRDFDGVPDVRRVPPEDLARDLQP